LDYFLGQRFGIQFSTMGAPDTAQGPAAVRYAPYIEELQEFFASSCLRYGSPEDIIAMTDRLESSPAFAEDLSSMIRSIVLREGGEVQHSQLLEILAIATGGEKMDHSPQHYGQPLRNLLSFLTSVLRKPWNEPPPEPVRAEVLPFPTRPRHAGERGHGQAAAISAATERAAYAEHALRYPAATPAFPKPEPMPATQQAHQADPLGDPRSERKVPDLIGEPTPPDRSAFDPHAPADQAVEEPDLPEEETSDADTSTAVTLPTPARRPVTSHHATAAAVHTATPNSALPAGSAAEHIVKPAGAQLSPASATAAAASPATPPAMQAQVPAATDAPSWQLAAEAVRGIKHEAVREAHVSPWSSKREVAHFAGASTPVQRASAETDTARAFAAAPAFRTGFQKSSPAPPVAGTAVPTRKAPEPAPVRSHYAPRVPRTPAGMLVAGAALLVLAGIFAASLHRAPTELTGKQPPQPPQNAPRPASTAQPQEAPPFVTAPEGSAAPQRLLRIRRATADEDDRGVAPPYSTPIPGQAVAAKPSPYGPQAAQQPAPGVRTSRPPSDEVASTWQPQQLNSSDAGHEYESESYAGGQPGFHPGVGSAYRNPDAAIAGDLPRSGGSRSVSGNPDQVEVSSGMMAGYLISAPKPDYPGLAKIAHIGGPVVLQAVIAKNGSVIATHTLSGHRLLRGAAEDAVRRWRFRPYVMDGHPVEVSTIITVRFNPKH
jgi:TonB family protein